MSGNFKRENRESQSVSEPSDSGRGKGGRRKGDRRAFEPEIDVKLDYFQGTAGTYAGYDRFGRIKDQFWDNYGTSMMLPKPDVDRFMYGYDYASNRTYRDIDSSVYATNDKDQLFSYDGLHRLANYKQGTLDLTAAPSITGTPAAEQIWGLDALGNWKTFVKRANGGDTLNQERYVNTANEIDYPTGSTSPFTNTVGGAWANTVYDAAGNLTNGPNAISPNQPRGMVYDAWNRVVEVKQDSTVLEQYEYDGLNRRIVRTIAPATTNKILHSYYNEDWQELEVRQEVSGSQDPDPLEQFIWHPYYIDALATRFYDDDLDGTAVQHYYTHDANFNITTALNTSGDPVERYDYTPYGQVTFLDASFGSPSSSSSIAQRYLYTGRPLDGAGGLYHYRNRQYDPNLGNFITRDPIGYEGGDENLYRYVSNAPLVFTDPLGNERIISQWEEGQMCIKKFGYGACRQAWDCKFVAERLSQRAKIGGSTDGPEDALRHCIWMCCLSATSKKSTAIGIGKLHEQSVKSDPDARDMDLHNNSIGASIGKLIPRSCVPQECLDNCLDALYNGFLIDKLPPLPPRWNPGPLENPFRR